MVANIMSQITPSGSHLLAAGSIVRVGSTATVTHIDHGFSEGDSIEVVGAAQADYNGVFVIAVTGLNTFTYTVSGTPVTPATNSTTNFIHVAKSLSPDVGYSYRYQLLWDWKDAVRARGVDLVSRDVVEIAELFSGNAMTIQFNSTESWVVDSTHYVWVRAAPGHDHGGVYTTSKAYMSAGNASYGGLFASSVGYVRFGPGIVVETSIVGQWYSEYMCPSISGVPAGQPVTFDGLIFYRKGWSMWGAVAIQASTVESELIIKNCLILHRCIGDGNWYPAICVKGDGATQGAGHIKIYNTAVISGNNISTPGGTCVGTILPKAGLWSITTENCYLHPYGTGASAAYDASGITKGSKDATSTGEATAPSLQNIPFTTATFLNVTLDTEDLRTLTGSALRDVGTDLTSEGVTTDIIGTARPSGSGFDVGPFESNDIPICWNYTAQYKNSSKLYKASGCGSFPRNLNIPSNVDKSSGKMIDDGDLIDPRRYEVR